MSVHFPVKLIQQEPSFQVQHLIQGIHMKLIDVRLIGRGHPAIIAGKLCGLLTALYTCPTVPALYKVIRRLALILPDLETGYVRRQPVYPCESPGHRVYPQS